MILIRRIPDITPTSYYTHPHQPKALWLETKDSPELNTCTGHHTMSHQSMFTHTVLVFACPRLILMSHWYPRFQFIKMWLKITVGCFVFNWACYSSINFLQLCCYSPSHIKIYIFVCAQMCRPVFKVMSFLFMVCSQWLTVQGGEGGGSSRCTK